MLLATFSFAQTRQLSRVRPALEATGGRGELGRARGFCEERVKATPANYAGPFDEIPEFAKMWGVR